MSEKDISSADKPYEATPAPRPGYGPLKPENELPYPGAGAQRIMRQEMEAGVHKNQPVKASAVLAEMLGPVSEDQAVSTMALKVIGEYEGNVTFSLGQWPHVQRMIEAGIRAGHDAGMGTGLG